MATKRTLTSIAGNSQSLDGGAMFGNAPKALWSRWCEPDDRNRIAFACRALLVRDAGRTILFETGIGAFFSPKMKDRFGIIEDEHVLLRSLSEHGLEAGDIDVIVLSHLHFDHAGGLLKKYVEGEEPALAFPNSRIVVGEEAWRRSQNPHPRDRASFIPQLASLLLQPLDGGGPRLEIVTGEHSEVLGEGFRMHRSSGHTPGMMLAEIAMPDGPVVFVADLIPGLPWVHVPITMGYDRFPELLIDEKQALLEDLISRGGRLFYTHDYQWALSGLSRDERGRFSAKDPLASISLLDR
jgi:glyoxylase-like metal-dependent hydrolase (beta-lactamase superfamily II)